MAVLKQLKHLKFWNNENILKSTALLHLYLSCPLKSFLLGSYYAAETFLKAAPTLEQKLSTLCNTTVQLHQWKTNRFQHSPAYHSPGALCSVSWSVTCCWHFLIPSCFQEKYAYTTTNNPMWVNPTARIHHSCSKHVHASCLANGASALPLNVQLYPWSKGTFLKPPPLPVLLESLCM